MSAGRITLLTDFGASDGYVAAMKGVLAREAPGVRIDDAAHDVPAGDVRAGSWALAAYWSIYPEGTVHLVVIDPGVGTERRAIAVEAAGRLLVGPDNGVLTPALSVEGSRGVVLPWDADRAPPSGHTFHGRDLFAPAAARLASGAPLESLGPELAEPVLLEEPEPVAENGWLVGEVVHVDRFGNLITNLPGSALRGAAEVVVADRPVRVGRSYGEAAPGTLLALVNSFGRVEIGRTGASAAEGLGRGRGASVRIEGRPGEE